jgi:hypothetical protein
MKPGLFFGGVMLQKPTTKASGQWVGVTPPLLIGHFQNEGARWFITDSGPRPRRRLTERRCSAPA